MIIINSAYLDLFSSGELEKRVEKAYDILKDCKLCPHHCHVDRTKNETGYCQIGKEIIVASFAPHYGEEAPLVGNLGSGTVFFSSCNLKCIYCQNYDISHLREGSIVTVKELGKILIDLQNKGCHNINFVTASHMIHAVLASILEACKEGLKIPIVYNTGAYDDIEALKLLDGVVDIYLPDIKYSDENIALKYSKISNYIEIVKKAVKEMHRQVGDLKIEGGIAKKGLIVRHLVLPENLAGTKEVMDFISKDISEDTYLNIMDQYYPAYKAIDHDILNRRISREEYKEVLEIAEKAKLKRVINHDDLFTKL
ncbi:radical SAM protein [Natronospora cellulosivora (SeqCode)]